MSRKKTKKNDKVAKPKKAVKTKKAQSKSKKKSKDNGPGDDMGLIVIEDEFNVDKKLELEERKAYLEEARSQEASD